MNKPEAALIACAGLVMGITGLVMELRALARYAKTTTHGGSTWNPRNWLFEWDCSEIFDDSKGRRLYHRGAALRDIGLMIVVAVMAYSSGRGW